MRFRGISKINVLILPAVAAICVKCVLVKHFEALIFIYNAKQELKEKGLCASPGMF